MTRRKRPLSAASSAARSFSFSLRSSRRAPSSCFSANEELAQGGRPGERQPERRQQRHAHRDGQRAKEHAGHAADRDQRQEHDDRRDGRADQRRRDLAQRAVDGFEPALPGVAVQRDVLDHDDGVVDHQAHGRGQSAQRHQVEALVRAALSAMNVTSTVTGMTSAATAEAPQSRRNSTMMIEARTRPIRMASRTLLIDSVTISD